MIIHTFTQFHHFASLLFTSLHLPPLHSTSLHFTSCHFPALNSPFFTFTQTFNKYLFSSSSVYTSSSAGCWYICVLIHQTTWRRIVEELSSCYLHRHRLEEPKSHLSKTFSTSVNFTAPSRNNVNFLLNLTFRGPCIVIYSYNKTNEMH